MEFYDEWLPSGVEALKFEAGNKKPTSWHLIVTLILEIWVQFNKELIV